MRSNQSQPQRHLIWILGFAAALLTVGIEVALIGMPEAGAPERVDVEQAELAAGQR